MCLMLESVSPSHGKIYSVMSEWEEPVDSFRIRGGEDRLTDR